MKLCFALSAACIIYFAAILLFVGITTSFCGIWLILAAMFLLLGLSLKRHRTGPAAIPSRAFIFLWTSFFLGVTVFGSVVILELRTALKAPDSGMDYCIVLGGRVYSDHVSKPLKFRLDTAYAYWEENPDTTFILSGGQGANEPIPEAMAMYDYLSQRGVPQKQLVLEMDSRSTRENLAYSKLLIDILEEKKHRYFSPSRWDVLDKPAKIGIVTSDYHMFRALKIAEAMGISIDTGIPSPTDAFLFVHQVVREVFATVKDFMLGHMG